MPFCNGIVAIEGFTFYLITGSAEQDAAQKDESMFHGYTGCLLIQPQILKKCLVSPAKLEKKSQAEALTQRPDLAIPFKSHQADPFDHPELADRIAITDAEKGEVLIDLPIESCLLHP